MSTRGTPSEEPADDEHLVEVIRTVIRLARIAQQVCEEVGLTLPQYRALNSAARGKRRAFELARYTASTRPAMSALTSGLEKMELLERSHAEGDGRGVYFVASTKGHQALVQAEKLLVERFTEILGPARSALELMDCPTIEAALNLEVDRQFGPPASAP